MSSYNLIEFTPDNNIILNKEHYMKEFLKYKQEKYIFIGIIGGARKGKSSFMNLMISFITNKNIHAFSTSPGGEHCTRGINYFIYDKYVFLDCEGLAKDDSSNDISLLLISYILSDILIFNDTTDFNNTSIQQLVPLTAFSSHINVADLKHKPHLVVRIANYELEADINIVINRLITSKFKDNYQSIRESIKQLFSSYLGIYTEPFTKSVKKIINEHKYLELLTNREEDLGFMIAINEIITLSKKIKLNSYIERIELIDNIIIKLNKKEFINIKDLDINILIQEKFVNEFIMLIDKNLYNNIEITTGYNDEYQTITARDSVVKLILDNFNDKFSSYEPTLFSTNFAKLRDELYKPIIKAFSESKAKYDAFLNSTYKSNYAKLEIDINLGINQLIDNNIIKYYKSYNKLFKYDIKSDITKFFEELFIKHIFKPYELYSSFKEEFINYNVSLMHKLSDFIYNIILNYLSLINTNYKKLQDYINEVISYIHDSLNESFKIDIYASYEDNINKYIINDITSKNKNIEYKHYTVAFDIENILVSSKFTDTIFTGPLIDISDILEKKLKQLTENKIFYQRYVNLMRTKIQNEVIETPIIKPELLNNEFIKLYYLSAHIDDKGTNNWIISRLFVNKSNYYTDNDLEKIQKRINKFYNFNILIPYIITKENIINFNNIDCDIIKRRYYIKKLRNKMIKNGF